LDALIIIWEYDGWFLGPVNGWLDYDEFTYKPNHSPS